MAKYMENAFLAMKVAFCNEFFDLCEGFGVDFEEARGLWLQDWRIGESHTLVTPERGYGGKCLPKDVAAVCATGRETGVPMEIMEAVQHANLRHRAAGERPSQARRSRNPLPSDSALLRQAHAGSRRTLATLRATSSSRSVSARPP